MSDDYSYYLVVVGLIGLAYLINYLKKKRVINDSVSSDIGNAIKLAKLILDVVPINDNVKDKTTLVFSVSDIVAEYVYFLEVKPEDKVKLTLDTSIEILKKFNISPTSAQIQLMEYAIFESMKWISDKNKTKEKLP